MKISDIYSFFKELDSRIHFPIIVTLTGGAAAIIYGSQRATQDIDFEVTIKVTPKKKTDSWDLLAAELKNVSELMGISAQYADDFDRWSSIAMPSRKSKLVTKIGKVEVRVLDHGLWAIGKLSRYLITDVEDLQFVLKKVKSDPGVLARLWGKALGVSPPSPAQSEFKQHVDRFFDQYGEELWKKKVSPRN